MHCQIQNMIFLVSSVCNHLSECLIPPEDAGCLSQYLPCCMLLYWLRIDKAHTVSGEDALLICLTATATQDLFSWLQFATTPLDATTSYTSGLWIKICSLCLSGWYIPLWWDILLLAEALVQAVQKFLNCRPWVAHPGSCFSIVCL